MNLTNLFEDDGRTPNPNYAEELAYQIFKASPNLDTTGAADEVLDYAFDLAVHDLGRKRAHSLFAYDEDFDSDLVNAYLDLQMNQQGVAEGGPYDLPGIDYPRPGDTPAKPRYRGQQTPGVNPDDEAYFREIWRKNKLAQQQKERDADHERLATGTNESRMSEIDAEYQDYKKLSPREFYNMYKMTKQQWFEKHKGLLQGVTEADKKKDELEPEVRDVALQRAITRAKADFPTAGSGLEALAKDFMRGQDQDQKSFDQIRQAERQQDQMLDQIAKIDQEQEQEIQGLEQQNSGLASRLQQLQNVNSELEKKLAAMSGRRAEKKSKSDSAAAPAPTSAKAPEPVAKKATKAKSKSKPAPQKSSMKSTASQLAAPKADPLAAMANRIQHGDSSILEPKQAALQFEPSDNVLEPIIPQRQQDPRFAAARANATDADVKYGRELADRIKQQMAAAGRASPEYPEAERLKAMKSQTTENDEQEADYDDKYQSMVARVGQKAREQEKNKPVDIADLARRLAAIEASRKDK